MTAILNDADIAIAGAGPAGQALASLLIRGGFPAARIAVFDAKTAEQSQQDVRTIALSAGSRQILEQAGGWPVRATAIHEIHVSRRGHFGRTLIRHEDYQLPALGYVARYGDIIRPLEQALQPSDVQFLRPVKITGLQEQHDHVQIQTVSADGRTHQYAAGMVIQAEGGTFTDQEARGQRRDYDQTAVIAHVCFSGSIAHRAFERFTDQGPLALLPEDDGYALVWCVRPELAEQLMQLDDAAFCAALQQAFGQRLGSISSISKRNAFPLGLNAQHSASARIVSIGNAAQTLHPVAGQGLNLGLRDVSVLARAILQNGTQTEAAIQDFMRLRGTDRQLTIGLTDTLARIFASSPDGSLRQSLLGAGLALLDVLPPARHALAGHMMYGWRN